MHSAHRTRPFTALLLAGLASAACSKKVSTGTYQARQDAGDVAYTKADYAEAEKQYRANLEDAENYGPPEQIPTALHYLANVYNAQRRYAEAEKLYRQEVARAEELWGEGDPRTLRALTDVGLFYVDQGRLADAAAYNDKALAIVKRGVGPDYEGEANLAQAIDSMIQTKQP